ncbi:unnamed protein product [Brachionus calyciflorus]|uniref:Uncharacterized protein n=1 Tax=Brachionus calyciflorus TaxID=104777 RepID=A0A814BVY8_9BILA|nr:unnamed protein product [Brachionus calyciflorus]
MDTVMNEPPVINENNVEQFNVENLAPNQARAQVAKKGARIVKQETSSKTQLTGKNLQFEQNKPPKGPNTSNCGKTNPPFYNPERVFGPKLPNSQRRSAPQYSFGVRRESLSDLTNKNGSGCPAGRSPGPIYDITKAANYVKKRAPAFTIGLKTRLC